MNETDNRQYLIEHTVIDRCRCCESTNLQPVFDLGVTPLADRLLDEATIRQPEPVCPLTVVFCSDCGLLQIRETIAPAVLFPGDYPYFSSVSEQLLRHFGATVDETRSRKLLDDRSLVIELASNDGCLLRNYQATGIPVLGIDPVDGPVHEARRLGIDTLHAFFTTTLAHSLRQQGVVADVVHANNVLAHVADTNGFVSGIATILKDDGMVVIECPYVLDLVRRCEFDTIYHQHLCYFSLHALAVLFGRHELFINDVQYLPIHGGSLRLFISRQDAPQAGVTEMLRREREAGATELGFYAAFPEDVAARRDAVTELLDQLKGSGARIAGYGAPAKACTLMRFMGIGANYLDYLVDKNRFKQGKYYPGNHLPIHAPEYLLEDCPDYTLLLSWNFADEILAEQQEYRRRGGKFVVPIPDLKVI